MKITVETVDAVDLSQEMKERVASVLALATEISETRKILREIRTASASLSGIIWSESDKKEIETAVEYFDESMQSMAYTTMQNLERYQISGWMELFDREEDANES